MLGPKSVENIGTKGGTPAFTQSYRDELKTHSRHVLGAHLGFDTPGEYLDLRWFKNVFVVI